MKQQKLSPLTQFSMSLSLSVGSLLVSVVLVHLADKEISLIPEKGILWSAVSILLLTIPV